MTTTPQTDERPCLCDGRYDDCEPMPGARVRLAASAAMLWWSSREVPSQVLQRSTWCAECNPRRLAAITAPPPDPVWLIARSGTGAAHRIAPDGATICGLVDDWKVDKRGRRRCVTCENETTATLQQDLESAAANPSLTVEAGPDPLEMAIEAAKDAYWFGGAMGSHAIDRCVRAAAPHIERAHEANLVLATDMVQVGWMGPYGIVPGGMDVDAPDHWKPVWLERREPGSTAESALAKVRRDAEQAAMHRLADEWAADRHVPTWIADRIRARAEAVGTEGQ